MSKYLQFEMTTPEKVALQTTAEFVVLPAFEGEMGVLPNHAPFLVELAPGEVRVTKDKSVTRYAVSGGFAEIKDNKVSLFAETAEDAQAIDAERARQALERAKGEAVRKDLDPIQLMAAEAAIRRAQVRLRVGLRKHQPSGPQPHD
jgi:F-type H+-transporting ATPase subunit epsilon